MPIAELRAVVLDCPDPLALAEFYRELVGGEITSAGEASQSAFVKLRDESGGVRLAFQQVDDYRPPDWPSTENPQQAHVDVTVAEADLESAEQRVLALGARRHDYQPGLETNDTFVVYVDPAGHPFCFCWDN